ncbi:MAG: hypothetical protein Q4A41_04145 [Bacillota bacterium]|nr:hypothetical protein [Bacillota bacterium]
MAEFRSESAEIGTAVSNIDDTGVIIITMYRPSYLALSTKNQLDNLYNFLSLEEDQEKTRIILKNVDGRLFEHFINSTSAEKNIRIQIALELLKKMLRYDEFPNSVKLMLIAEDQILLNENGVYLRELVNYTSHTTVSDKEIVASLGNTIAKLLPNLEGAEAILIDQMIQGNNNFYSIADVYSAFRDVFIYQIPASLEKRIYVYRQDEDIIDAESVDEFLRTEETRRLEQEKKREELRREHKIDEFEQKIANQTDYSVGLDTDGFESKEVRLESKETKKILDSMEDFEIVRAVQPKTIDLNQISKDITNSLDEIVNEFTNYGKQKIEDEQLAEPEHTSSHDDLIETETIESDQASKAKNKEGRKAKKRKNKKHMSLTEALDDFADDALKAADMIEEDDQKHKQEDGRNSVPETPSHTQRLDADDEDSPIFKFNEYDTNILDDESASDLDRFYKRMDDLDNDNKNRKIRQIVAIALSTIFLVAVFVIAFFFFRDSRQPIVPGFDIKMTSLSNVQCVNTSSGQNKITKYHWQVYQGSMLLAEENIAEPQFNFKAPGKFTIKMTATDRDGKVYETIEKTVEITFEVPDRTPDSTPDPTTTPTVTPTTTPTTSPTMGNQN